VGRPSAWFRTVLSSLGPEGPRPSRAEMAREAKRRRFFGRPARPSLGDGLGPGQLVSIWEETHFPTVTPILDLITWLEVSYLFVAAPKVAVPSGGGSDAWDQ